MQSGCALFLVLMSSSTHTAAIARSFCTLSDFFFSLQFYVLCFIVFLVFDMAYDDEGRCSNAFGA